MSSYELVTADVERLPHRSVYGPVKRFKRRMLRAVGRWHRADYDVHLVFETITRSTRKSPSTTLRPPTG